MDEQHETGSHPLPAFTLGEAAKHSGRSKPTLSKAIKNGKLSAEKQPDGSYRIQVAELFRAFPPETPRFDGTETRQDTRLPSAEIAVLRERLAERDSLIADLREDRDRWRGMAERLLLTTSVRSEVPQRRRWRLWPFRRPPEQRDSGTSTD
jgi:hypothetical protein